MKKIISSLALIVLVFVFSSSSYSQSDNSPGKGSSAPGQVVYPEVVDIMALPLPNTERNILAPMHKRGEAPDQEIVDIIKNSLQPVEREGPNLFQDKDFDAGADINLHDSWNGPNFNGWQPPDCDIAVGPLHVMAVTNEQFHIYDRTSSLNLLTTSTFQNFFPSGTGSIFDPKVIYDPWAFRWIFIALQRSGLESYYRVAVSQTSDPTGLWWAYTLNAHVNGSTSTTFWADYPGLGFSGGSISTGAIAITSNQYNQSDQFQYGKVRLLKRSELYVGAAVTWYDFWNFNNGDGSTVFTPKPAQNWFSDTQVYMLNTKAGGWDKVTLWRIDNPTAGVPSLVRQNTVSVNPYQAPPNAPMLGGGTVDAFDCRTQDVVLSNNRIFTSYPDSHNWGSGNNSNVRYLQIVRNTGAVIEDAGIGLENFWYIFPDVAPQFKSPFGTDSVGIAFSRSSSTIFPQSRVVGHDGSSFTGSLLTAAGTGNLGGGNNRFGDYTGIAIDPLQNGHLWSLSERGRTSTWGTGIGYFSFFNVVTNTQTHSGEIPGDYSLSQNYPNPFNPVTKIKYGVPSASNVSITIYDMLGREVRVLVNQYMKPGNYEAIFNGAGLSSGVYLYSLRAGSYSETKRMILSK